jgi:hypothetical protein
MKNARIAVVVIALLIVAGTVAAMLQNGPAKACDTSMQKMAHMDTCDDALALDIIKADTARQEVFNALDDRLLCVKLKGALIKDHSTERHIEYKLAESGYNLDCTEKGGR